MGQCPWLGIWHLTGAQGDRCPLRPSPTVGALSGSVVMLEGDPASLSSSCAKRPASLGRGFKRPVPQTPASPERIRAVSWAPRASLTGVMPQSRWVPRKGHQAAPTGEKAGRAPSGPGTGAAAPRHWGPLQIQAPVWTGGFDWFCLL